MKNLVQNMVVTQCCSQNIYDGAQKVGIILGEALNTEADYILPFCVFQLGG